MPAISIARLYDELMVIYAPPRRAASTRRQVAQVMREITAVPGVRKSSDLRSVTIAKWMDLHPDRTAVTTKSLLRCLRAITTYAIAEGYLKHSPFSYRKVNSWIRDDAAPPARTLKHRSIEDVTRVLELADAEASGGAWDRRRLRMLVNLYAYLGLRMAEAPHLWVSDVDLFRSALHLQAHAEDGWRPKTLRSAAVLPLAGPLVGLLADWIPDTGCRWVIPGKKRQGPWLHGGPGVRPLDQVRELGARAGVPGLTIASFRKTIGTFAKSWGFSQLELKALLRHSSVETQRWYDEDEVEALRPATAKIQFPRLVS